MKLYRELLERYAAATKDVLEGLNVAIIQNGEETDHGGMLSMLNHAGHRLFPQLYKQGLFYDGRQGLIL